MLHSYQNHTDHRVQDRGLHLPQYEHHEVTAAALSSSMSFFGGDLLINMGAMLVQARSLFTFVCLFI